jgi:hypothetical protein
MSQENAEPGIRPAIGLLLAAVIALALGACGGDGGGDGGDDRRESRQADEIVGVITEAAKSRDPDDCTKLNTERFLEQRSGLRDEAAIRECERVADLDVPQSVKVSNISVNGGAASAEAAVRGSELDGQTITLDLVNRGGRWKLNQVTGFVSFDREALKAGVAKSFRRVKGVPSEFSDCVVSRLDGLSDDELQDIYLSFDKRQLYEIVIACQEEARSRSSS